MSPTNHVDAGSHARSRWCVCCVSFLVQFSVFDSNKLMRNELIGAFQFDASTVYLNTDHEFYRQVCGLRSLHQSGCA